MPPLDFVRIRLGLGTPILLIGVVATRWAFEAHGLSPVYERILYGLWVSDGEGRQLAMLVPGWLHGCLGVWFAFKRHEAVMRLKLPLFAAALLVPVLAGLGFVVMGREIGRLAADPGGWGSTPKSPAPTRAGLARLRDGLLAPGSARRPRLRRARGPRGGRAAFDRVVTIGYPGGDRCRGLDGARGQPQPRHSAHVGVRRPCAMLDLPRASDGGPRRLRAAGRRRGAHARARRRAARRATGVPPAPGRLGEPRAAGHARRSAGRPRGRGRAPRRDPGRVRGRTRGDGPPEPPSRHAVRDEPDGRGHRRGGAGGRRRGRRVHGRGSARGVRDRRRPRRRGDTRARRSARHRPPHRLARRGARARMRGRAAGARRRALGCRGAGRNRPRAEVARHRRASGRRCEPPAGSAARSAGRRFAISASALDEAGALAPGPARRRCWP